MEPMRLNGLHEIVNYEEGLLRFKSLVVSNAFRFIKEVQVNKLNKEVKGIQLGWDSFAVFSQEGEDFNLSYIKKYDKTINDLNKWIKITDIPEGTLFKTIYTRAVDVCTFICLRCGKKYIVGHFNCERLEEAFAHICTSLYSLGKIDYGFISLINEEQEIKFMENITKVDASKFKFYFRSKKNDGLDNGYLSHFEIGMYIDDGIPKIFGDVTARDILHDNNNCACVFLFNDANILS